MRRQPLLLLLVATLVLGTWVFTGAASTARAEASLIVAAETFEMAQAVGTGTAIGAAAQSHDDRSRDDLEFLPKAAEVDSETSSSAGLFLIIAAVVVFVVIVVFIIRHHQIGRAG